MQWQIKVLCKGFGHTMVKAKILTWMCCPQKGVPMVYIVRVGGKNMWVMLSYLLYIKSPHQPYACALILIEASIVIKNMM